jgi:hypothetical protein
LELSELKVREINLTVKLTAAYSLGLRVPSVVLQGIRVDILNERDKLIDDKKGSL